MKKYIIRAALHEEANEGWVWQGVLSSRTTLKISRNINGTTYSVYCQSRRIDDNFRDRYNQSPDEKSRLEKEGKVCRIDIQKDRDVDTLVMGEWYRDALGGFGTTSGNNGLVELEVAAYDVGWKRWWGPFRAAAHHPDIVVRLGTRLGVIGAWLGLVGVGIPLLEMLFVCAWLKLTIALMFVLVFSFAGSKVCWPPASPSKTNHDA